jgi:hypothetical protein
MRFSLVVAILLVSITVSGVAQQKNTFKVKPSHPEAKAKSNVPISPTGGATTASASTAKDLNAVEHQSLKSAQTPKSAGKKNASPALTPVKDKPNPPINFNGGGSKNSPQVNQGANPYKGRLRQKHTRQ